MLAARTLQAQVAGISAFDLPTWLATAAALSAVAAFATWWPAWRASRRDPLDALKEG